MKLFKKLKDKAPIPTPFILNQIYTYLMKYDLSLDLTTSKVEASKTLLLLTEDIFDMMKTKEMIPTFEQCYFIINLCYSNEEYELAMKYHKKFLKYKTYISDLSYSDQNKKNTLLLSIYNDYFKDQAITSTNYYYYFYFMKLFLNLDKFESAVVIYHNLRNINRLNIVHCKIILEYLIEFKINLFDGYYQEIMTYLEQRKKKMIKSRRKLIIRKKKKNNQKKKKKKKKKKNDYIRYIKEFQELYKLVHFND